MILHSAAFAGASDIDSAALDHLYPHGQYGLAQQHSTVQKSDNDIPVQCFSLAPSQSQSQYQAMERHKNECSLIPAHETLVNTTMAQHPDQCFRPHYDITLSPLDDSLLTANHDLINAGRISFPTQQRAQVPSQQFDRLLPITQPPSFEYFTSNIMTPPFVNGNVIHRPVSRNRKGAAQESSVTTPQSICSSLLSDYVHRNGSQRFDTPASTIDTVELPQKFPIMSSGQPQAIDNQVFGTPNNLGDGQSLRSSLLDYTTEANHQTSRAQSEAFGNQSRDGQVSLLSNIAYLDNSTSSIADNSDLLDQSISPFVLTAPFSNPYAGAVNNSFSVYGDQQYIKPESPDHLDEQLVQHGSVPIHLPMLADPQAVFPHQIAQGSIQPQHLYDFNTPLHNQFPYYQSPVPSNEWPPSGNAASDSGSARGRTVNRNADLDRKLVEWRKAGLSYKEIQRRGNFGLEESTLRGRYRTLTKRKEERVRKPEWPLEAERALLDAVEAEAPVSARKPQSKEALAKIPWKKVARWMVENRNTYHYGNATVKKKYSELIHKGRVRYRYSSNTGCSAGQA